MVFSDLHVAAGTGDSGKFLTLRPDTPNGGGMNHQ